MKKNSILAALDSRKDRSAWDRGVTAQAYDMVEAVELDDLPEDREELLALLLNGANEWFTYSYSGCALVYNGDIAERYMTPSELKRYNADGHDASMAFGGESLLGMQARACLQAFNRVRRTIAQLSKRTTK